MGPLLIALALYSRAIHGTAPPGSLSPVADGGVVLTLGNLTKLLRGTPDAPEVFIAPELKSEAIYLRGTFRDPASLRALVARATSAEWIRSGAGIVLERSPGLRKRLREDEKKVWAADLRAALPDEPAPVPLTHDEIDRLTAIAGRWNQGETESEKDRNNKAVHQAMSALDITSRAGRRWLAQLDVESLAESIVAAGHGEPLRLLGKGGGGFGRLPLDGAAFLTAFLADLDVRGAPTPPSGPKFVASARLRDQTLKSGETGTIVFGHPGALRFDTYAVAPDGTATPLTEQDLDLKLPRADEPLWPGEVADRDRKMIVAGAYMTENVAKAFSTTSFDPLHVLTGPFLEALMKEESRPVVIDLPDEAGLMFAYKSESFRENSRGIRASVSVEVIDGAIVGRPRRPLRATRDRFPRAQVPTWFAGLRNANLSLDEAAEITSKLGAGARSTWLETMMGLAAGIPVAFEHPLTFKDDRNAALALWAALPARVRAALDAGVALGPNDLTPESRAAMWRWLLLSERGRHLGVGFLDRRGETPPLALSAYGDRKPYVKALDGMNVGAILDIENFGYVLACQRQGEWLDPQLGYPDARTARLLLGARAMRTLMIATGPEPLPKAECRLTEMTFPKGGGVGWESLPAEVVKTIREYLIEPPERR